jgi:hypothetical protein
VKTAGTIISNGKQAACYGAGVAVPAGGKATLCEFAAPKAASMYGLTVGFGLSDVAAWGAGAAFVIYVGGREIVAFSDQIADLLRPEFLPVEAKGGESIRIDCVNATAAAFTASAFARVEAF